MDAFPGATVGNHPPRQATIAPPSLLYVLFILFLIIVSLLQMTCFMILQCLYNDIEFDSLFLIVYYTLELTSFWSSFWCNWVQAVGTVHDRVVHQVSRLVLDAFQRRFCTGLQEHVGA